MDAVNTSPTSEHIARALEPAAPAAAVGRAAAAGLAGADEHRVRGLSHELDALRPRWWPRPARVLVLILTDLAAMAAACAAGYLLWGRPVVRQPWRLYAEQAPLLSFFVLSYATSGLYPGFGIGAVETLRRLTTRTTFAFMLLAAGVFVLKLPHTYSRMTFALAWVSSLALVPLARYLVLAAISRHEWWGEPTVLVGAGRQGARTVRLLRNAVSLGYRPIAVLAAGPRPEPWAIDQVPVLPDLGVAPLLAARGVRVALVAEDGGAAAGRIGSWLQQYFPHVVLLHDADDLPVEGVGLRNLGGILGIEFTNQLLRWHNRALKRGIDVALGSALLLATLPLMTLGAALIRLFSRGPVFYRQEREGRFGQPIAVRKLRTMRVDAESYLARFLEDRPHERARWERTFKLRHDPRVVPVVGKVLRRLSVDELPQLWNVLIGEMSLVGPRPFPEYHLEKFPREFRDLRRRVRPGITGLWQVMVRSDGGVEEQQMYDTYYIRNWSIWMDLYVLAKTLAAVLTTRGAY